MIGKVKLDQDEIAGQRVTATGSGWIEVNGARHAGALVLTNDSVAALASDATLASLADEACVGELIARRPAVVLLGTGASFALAPAALTERFNAAGIGLEAMDTVAACRTFNVLAGEARQVAAILLH